MKNYSILKLCGIWGCTDICIYVDTNKSHSINKTFLGNVNIYDCNDFYFISKNSENSKNLEYIYGPFY